jgi:hypothetical protein
MCTSKVPRQDCLTITTVSSMHPRAETDLQFVPKKLSSPMRRKYLDARNLVVYSSGISTAIQFPESLE